MHTVMTLHIPSWTLNCRNEHERAGANSVLFAALAAAHALRVFSGHKLSTLGLMSGQDRMLLVVYFYKRITVSILARELAVRPSTISKMADGLIAKGFMIRLSDQTDGRRTYLELTEKGVSLADAVVTLCNQIERELISSLSSAEISTMIEGITILDRAINARLRRLR